MKTERELLGLAGNEPIAPFSHRVGSRERRGVLLGRETNASRYAPYFSKKCNSLKVFQNLLRHLS